MDIHMSMSMVASMDVVVDLFQRFSNQFFWCFIKCSLVFLYVRCTKCSKWSWDFAYIMLDVRLLVGNLLPRFPRNLLPRFCRKITSCRGFLENHLPWSTVGIYFRDSVERLPPFEVFWKITYRDQPGESTTEILLKDYLLPRFSKKSPDVINKRNLLPRFYVELVAWLPMMIAFT